MRKTIRHLFGLLKKRNVLLDNQISKLSELGIDLNKNIKKKFC